MTDSSPPKRRRKGRTGVSKSERVVNYRNLRNPFPPVSVFTDDRIMAMHETSLRVLEELGLKVLLPKARDLFRAAGARVDDDTEMVYIGREIIEAAIASAPRSINLHGGSRERDVTLELGSLAILSGAGAPNVTDLERGRRPGSLADFRDLMKLNHHFDALHMLITAIEPQDVPTHIRHYEMMKAQLTLSDKVPVIFSRGTPQAEDSFEIIRDFRGLSDKEFNSAPHCYTIINTNSPRQLDIPMAQGLIDFAMAGQMSVVTPFCLMGAMAPLTVAGAITLSHAEALAGIALTQITKPGAPVCYGAFASNVDMKSGAPAFGTPEQVKATLVAGQMARLVGLPWRCAAGCAANINDAQAAHETQMSAWGSVLAGSTMLVHATGWLEGGLSVSFEKFITDMEVVQTFAELCQSTPADDSDIAFEALSDVQPGGHFFETPHTMERFKTAFYEPIVADWSNFGTWTERGEKDANQRSTAVWKNILENFQGPQIDGDKTAALETFIEKRTAEGGALPVS